MTADTKERILDAAERLFAEHGIGATSLRAVTKDAMVNLAAIHYHFGSKEELCRAVLARRVGPVNRKRLALLDEIEAAEGERRPALEAILHAFLHPVVDVRRSFGARGAVLSRLIGRLYAEPTELVRPLLEEQFRETAERFVAALERALPALPPQEIRARFQFVVGVLTHMLSGRMQIDALPGGGAEPSDEALLDRMSAFLAAGLRAPNAGGASGRVAPGFAEAKTA